VRSAHQSIPQRKKKRQPWGAAGNLNIQRDDVLYFSEKCTATFVRSSTQ
jgi:hypothetical protein